MPDFGVVPLPPRKTPPFSTPRNDFVSDTKMSHDARFVMIYLWSKPDDWVPRANDINEQMNCGDWKRQRVMRELTMHGYMRPVRILRDSRFVSSTYGFVAVWDDPYPPHYRAQLLKPLKPGEYPPPGSVRYQPLILQWHKDSDGKHRFSMGQDEE